ncbi:MAG: TIGR02678 family protein [Acidimicrobiales bacterium]
MTLARVAVQLDPANELDDFQAAARALLTHGLVTERFPQAGVLARVRRFEEPLRSEFERIFHWRLDIGPHCARLFRRPVATSHYRPARTVTQSRRAFTPQAYASLCMVLAAIEGLGEQTTIRQLADEVARLRAGDDALPFDLTTHAHRRAFVDAVAWLQERDVLVLLDGDTEAFLATEGNALYDVDRATASRLLLSPPSVLAGLKNTEDFLDEPYPPTPEGAQSRARHRVHRRLLTEGALYYDDLPADERDYARQRRARISADLERLTGCTLECRNEGQALIGLPAAEPFPASGAVAQAALLLGGELARAAEVEKDGGTARLVSRAEADGAWRRVLASYAGRFTAEYRAEPERLRVEATALLERLGLVEARGVHVLAVRPALARYRADVRLPEVFDV